MAVEVGIWVDARVEVPKLLSVTIAELEYMDQGSSSKELFDFILVSEQCESCHSTSFSLPALPMLQTQDGLCVLFSVDESRSGRKYTVHSSACCFLARLSESLFSS